MYIYTTVKKNPGSLTPQRFMLIRGLTNVNETCEAPTRNPEMQTCKSLKPILDGQSLANQGALYYPHLPVPYVYIIIFGTRGQSLPDILACLGGWFQIDWELEDEGYLPKQCIILGKSLKMTIHLYPFII